MDMEGGDQRGDDERVGDQEPLASKESQVSLRERTGAGEGQDDQLVGDDDDRGEGEKEDREAPVEGGVPPVSISPIERGRSRSRSASPADEWRNIFTWSAGARRPGPDCAAMRALVERCSQAAVDVEGTRVAQIKAGMVVLLGVKVGDTEVGVRPARREGARAADLRRGGEDERATRAGAGDPLRQPVHALRRHPQGHPAELHQGRPARGRRAAVRPLLRKTGAKKGVFGACMGVALINDGPVTVEIEVEAPEAKP